MGYFGVCVGAHIAPSWAILGSVLASVLNFRPCKAFAKNSGNTTKKDNSWAAMLMVFAAICLVVFVSFLLGHAALRLCLSHLRLMLGHRQLCWYHIGLMLGHLRGILWFVLLCWARVGTIVCLSWTILGYVGVF